MIAARDTGARLLVPRVVIALAALVVALSLVLVLTGSSERHEGWVPAVCLCFLAVIVGGELMRLDGLGLRGMSPISVAGAFGLALAFQLPHDVVLPYGAPLVIVVTALGMALGVLGAWRTHGGPLRVDGFAVRLLVVALVAAVFRGLPLKDDLSLMELEAQWADRRWILALSMLGVLLVGLAVETLVMTTLRSLDSGRSWRATYCEVLIGVAPASLAALSTAVVITLGMRSLGLVAVPLFLLPLVLMRSAMRRQQRTRTARRQAIAALSRMTDLAGYTRTGHSGRVSRLCLEVGHTLHLSEHDLTELESAALLHDIGQVSLHEPIPAGATVEAAPVDQQRIADDGALIVRRTGVLDQVAAIIEQQAVPFRRLREQGQPQLLTARVLKVCNAYDDLTRGEPQRREVALERIMLGLGYEYDPAVVDAVAKVTGHPTAP